MSDALKTVAGALLVGASLLSGNAALITVAGGIGVNWTSDGLSGLWQGMALRLRPGTPLSRAYQRAVQNAVGQLRRDYAREAGQAHELDAFDLVATSAEALAEAQFPAAAISAESVQTGLADALDDLLHGHDARQVAYLKRHLLEAVARAFRDEMAADAEAWQRYHGWLIESLARNGDALSQKLDRFSDVLARWQDLAGAQAALDASQACLEVMLRDLQRRMDEPRAPSAGTSFTFDNTGMSVAGDVNQGLQTVYSHSAHAELGGSAIVVNVNNPAPPQTRPHSPSPPQPDKVALRQLLTTKFSREEFDLLCTDIQGDLLNAGITLPVSLDIVGGKGLEGMALNLIEYLDRRGYLGYLVAAVHRSRPGSL